MMRTWLPAAAIALALACGSSDQPGGMGVDASGQGGTSSTGTGGSGGSGGENDASSQDAPAICFGDSGKLVPAAKACNGPDSDCFALHVATCCGPDLSIGIAKGALEYAACFSQATGPDACRGLGCAKQLATLAEDGQTTEMGGAPVARCVMLATGGECSTQITYPPSSGDR
jgi:hypothetical protein